MIIKNDKPKGEKNEKSIFVIGNSVVKHLNGWEMSQKLNSDCKMFDKTFLGVKITCMNDYVITLVRSSPDHFILRVGTNDLSSDESPEERARSIIFLSTSIKGKKHDVSISLEEKRCSVNSLLGKLCKERNDYLIDHENEKKLFKQGKVTFKSKRFKVVE